MAEAVVEERKRDRAGTFAALRESADYRRYYLGHGVSLIGTWLQTAAVEWIVYDRTDSTWWAGVVVAAGVLPGLFVGLFAGALADRVAPKRLILAMQVAQMTLALLLALVVGLDAFSLWALVAIVALTRVCVTFEMPSRQVYLYGLVGRERLMNAIALNSGLFNASRVIGPALAGICLVRLGGTACFALNGASYLAAIAALLTIRTEVGRADSPRDGISAALLGGFALLGRDRRLRALFVLMAAFGGVGMGYMALIPAFARKILGTEAIGYSVLLSSIGVGATAGALFVASLGGLKRRDRLVVGGMALFAAMIATAGLVPGWLAHDHHPRLALAIASLCLAGGGFGGISFFSATQTLIQTTVPDQLRGRIMGIWMIAYSGSVPLGSLASGWLAGRLGVPFVLELSAALCLAMALATLLTGAIHARHEIRYGSDPAVDEPAPAS